MVQKPTDSSRKRRLLVVDDHPIVRRGLAQLIDQQDDLEVTALASSAAEALGLIGTKDLDLAVVDLALGGVGGLQLIRDIKVRRPELPVLVLSMHDESVYAERAVRSGARGYVMKQEATENVLTAIRQVLGGKIYLSETMSDRMLHRIVDGPEDASIVDCLSDRELEVFEMIGRGIGTRDIAELLMISIKTVESHREHIKRKLRLLNAAELVQMAVQYAQDTGVV